MLKAYLYPQCGTCRKAKKWLTDRAIPFEEIHIVNNPPSKEEIYDLWQKSGLPLRRLFNTSGVVYRELKLKDKLPELSDDEQIELLASDGKLLKRPIVTDGTNVTIGYNEEQFLETWNKS